MTMAAVTAPDFAFPLNVYARLLELEEGRADYLHYGLFEQPSDTAGMAQRRASELLWKHLPSPCRLLDVGLGLGTTLERLCRAGFEAVGLTPDATQIAFAKARHGMDLPALPMRLEDFSQDAGQHGQWQALLFQESGQYIDALELFSCASHLLNDEGEIIVMDEFALIREHNEPERLHFLEHFLRLAERFGFACTLNLELSGQAAPTVDWLLECSSRHAATLMDELSVSREQLAGLNASNRDYQHKYAARVYGYFLLRFKRARRPAWLPGRIDDHSAGAMRTLFQSVFHHEMSADHWQWKYGSGRGVGYAVWQMADAEGNRLAEPVLAAHYGGCSRDILYFGRPMRALQCGDVMVAATGRASLAKQGPLFLATATCLEQEIGSGTRHPLAFGFPNWRAFRLPERLGLYAEVGRMVEVRWPASMARPAMRLQVRELVTEAAIASVVTRCWQAMSGDLRDSIAGIRNFDHVRQRYIHHPDKHYRLYAVRRRWGGAAIGVFILCQQTDGTCELVDLIGARRWLPVLVHHARRVAAMWSCKHLTAWVSDTVVPALALPADARVHNLDIRIPANCWTAGPAIEEQCGHWWLMGGDTDFH